VIKEVQLRTAAWYGDRLVSLTFPAEWDVTVVWPQTPPPLSCSDIAAAVEQLFGQPSVREMCQGKSRPLVIVDDMNRPTPVNRVMPILLQCFADVGMRTKEVTILVATGMHGAPQADALLRKIGSEAASTCRILVHDPKGDLVKLGKTSFGTPVLVNKAVAASDFVVGIGGVYPNQTAGFGGGSKLILGVLGRRSVMHLHYRHKSESWGSPKTGTDFRRDLDQIARIAGLRTVISLQVNADREVVRVVCGDPELYYAQEVAFARESFRAPLPEAADVVIANAYPNDVSVTFVRKKGTMPLRGCPPGVSRVVIGACSEGAGDHALFPFVNRPHFQRQRQILQRISVLQPREIAKRIIDKLQAVRRRRSLRLPGKSGSESTYPIWLYRTETETKHPLPVRIPGMQATSCWPEILDAITKEQQGKQSLKVLIYPCAPLQCLDAQCTHPQRGAVSAGSA
jgi:nickel-dependent lactate racemase